MESSVCPLSPPNTYFYVQEDNLDSTRKFVENYLDPFCHQMILVLFEVQFCGRSRNSTTPKQPWWQKQKTLNGTMFLVSLTCEVVTSDHKQRKKSCHMCHLQFAFDSCVGRGRLMVTVAFNGGSDGQQQGIGKAVRRQATRWKGMMDKLIWGRLGNYRSSRFRAHFLLPRPAPPSRELFHYFERLPYHLGWLFGHFFKYVNIILQENDW